MVTSQHFFGTFDFSHKVYLRSSGSVNGFPSENSSAPFALLSSSSARLRNTLLSTKIAFKMPFGTNTGKPEDQVEEDSEEAKQLKELEDSLKQANRLSEMRVRPSIRKVSSSAGLVVPDQDYSSNTLLVVERENDISAFARAFVKDVFTYSTNQTVSFVSLCPFIGGVMARNSFNAKTAHVSAAHTEGTKSHVLSLKFQE